VTEVARSLRFAPELHALADRILSELTEGGAAPFNGLHLRIEKDARDWATIMGGQQVRRGGGAGAAAYTRSARCSPCATCR
jgi:hypothetical protein